MVNCFISTVRFFYVLKNITLKIVECSKSGTEFFFIVIKTVINFMRYMSVRFDWALQIKNQKHGKCAKGVNRNQLSASKEVISPVKHPKIDNLTCLIFL